MKHLTCAQMGGPEACNFEVMGNTAEEMAGNGGAHIQSSTDEAHAPMREMMENGTEEGKAQWMEDFRPKFEAAPEA